MQSYTAFKSDSLTFTSPKDESKKIGHLACEDAQRPI